MNARAGADDASIARAVDRLRAGGLVAFPTETVYGLGADARDEHAVRRVFEAKGRPARNPLIVHVDSEAMARSIAGAWPPGASALARRFWPGPLTIVVPRGPTVPLIVTGGGETVALRCPDHPVALALIRAFGGPIVGPSANPSGAVSPTTSARVRGAFPADQVLVLEGGPCRAGIESTVVSLVDRPARVLRRGAIAPEDIAAALGGAVDEGPAPVPCPESPLPAPGLLDRHYAPRAPARLVEPGGLHALLGAHRGATVVVLTRDGSLVVAPPHRVIRMPPDAPGYAARLYEALHEADDLRPALIAIQRPDDQGPLWDAVRDRLRRATTH
ncbi:MAG TPA: threonylcarbamoyl-AMP synthase [Phycisphaerales bacterium]|nr:threonylcarbamoyl-AMP synthase [Phycisphaerales bacterium]